MTKNIILTTICVGLLIALVSVIVIRGVAELMLPGEIAKIEQLRKDAAQISLEASESVMGQVAHQNQQIKLFQKYRELWWSRITVPKEWENVDVIAIQPRNRETIVDSMWRGENN